MRMMTDRLYVPAWHGANAMGSIACYDLNKAFLFNEIIHLWIWTVHIPLDLLVTYQMP